MHPLAQIANWYLPTQTISPSAAPSVHGTRPAGQLPEEPVLVPEGSAGAVPDEDGIAEPGIVGVALDTIPLGA